jgi:hypothetical protein
MRGHDPERGPVAAAAITVEHLGRLATPEGIVNWIGAEFGATLAAAPGTGAGFIVPPLGARGFAIRVLGDPRHVIAVFGGLEQHFTTFAETLPWLERALSPGYRLSVTSVGRHPFEWRLESSARPGTEPALEMGYPIFLRKFRNLSRQYYMNDPSALA